MKTNAARFLDSLNISYEIREYDVDPEDLAAESVARKVGLPPEQVFKTLVARAKKSYPVFADETIELFDEISISAGARGAQLILAPADYLRATGAKVGPIAKPKES